MEYIIYRKEKCGVCDGQGQQTFVNSANPDEGSAIKCNSCNGGYILTEVPLLDVLRKVRWSESMHSGISKICGIGEDVRIEE